MKKKPWNYMAGTESTGEYEVLARTGRGKVGVRRLGNNWFRIRLEPFGARFVSKMATGLVDWKQPGNACQNRFSFMATSENLKSSVKKAFDAIGYNTLVTKTNDELPKWAKELLTV